MINNGFEIVGQKIFDRRISSYSKKVFSTDNNIIHTMVCVGYKRLYHFEPLLENYSTEDVFEILRLNTYLKKERDKSENGVRDKYHYLSNSSMVYNYPIKYLTPRMFEMYKLCQKLKNKIDE
tara:strand:- start:329 stop:694 length:366 start_codon:yes stop_codon:yes gene_type:complete